MEHQLSRLDYIKDSEVVDNLVYFSANKEAVYEQLELDHLHYDYVQLPVIPRNIEGDIDHTKINSIGAISAKIFSEMKSRLFALNTRYKLELRYINQAEYIEVEVMTATRQSNEQPRSQISNKPALITNGELMMNADGAGDLVSVFRQRSNSLEQIIYYEKHGIEVQTYADLCKKASYLANGLKAQGLKQGDKLILQLPYSKGLIECFWACMLLGVIPVPVGMIDSYQSKNVATDKLLGIWRHLGKPNIITTHEMINEISHLSNIASCSINVLIIEKLKIAEELECQYVWSSDEPSLILYTSGSTGVPKGVILNQRNILGRTLGEIQMFGLRDTEVDLNWMTLTHAAGLIWSHIRGVYLGIKQLQINSELILNEPLLWLELMSKYRVSITWAPNFAYSLINNFLDDEVDYGWDLSNLKYVFSGGEANVSKNLRSFLYRLKKYSLPSNALKPAFGMTETSSCITYYNDFSYANSSDEDKFLSVGTPMPGAVVRIVNAAGTLLKEGEIGFVQGKGESFTQGYYNNEQANKDAFTTDGYLITGDLGYVKDNNLILTGREKDIIIINGLNYFVQDIEAVVDDIPEVNPSYSVATSIKKENANNETILVFFSPKTEELLNEESRVEELKELVLKVKNQIRKKCLINPDYVIPVLSSSSERTDIGKKQRNKYKSKFQNGAFNDVLNKLSDENINYILKRVWSRKNITTNRYRNICLANATAEMGLLVEQQGIKYRTLNNLSDTQEEDILLDFFFYEEHQTMEIVSQHIRLILERAHQYIREIAKLKKSLTVIFPTKRSINSDYDTTFQMNNSFLKGLLKTLSLENTLLKCRIIDFDEMDISLLANELNHHTKDETVIYREGLRYIPHMKSIQAANSSGPVILRNGLVAVVGGLGGVGFHISQYLLESYNSKLLIIGSSALDKNIEIYNQLREYSKNILYVKADITDYDQITEAVAEAESYWGSPLTSIINLAGKISSNEQEAFFDHLSSHTLENESIETMVDSAAVKLLGTYQLERLRKTKVNASMIVFSSLTANFGGKSMGAYSLANSWQENYCNYLAATGEKVFCISWSLWKKTGLSKFSGSSSAVYGGFHELEVEQGIKFLDYIINNNIVSSYVGIDRNALKMRCEIDDPYKLQLVVKVGDEDERNTVKEMMKEHYPQYLSHLVCIIDQSRKGSDAVLSDYQNRLLEIWKESLELEELHIKDNIFDLGGDSLTIYRLVNTISNTFSIQVKPIDIMMYPNIYELSAYLSGKSVSISTPQSKSPKITSIQQNRSIRKQRKG